MPLDPSIPLGVRPPQGRSPFETILQVEHWRSQRAAADALAEQRQMLAEQRRMEIDTLKREAAEERALRGLFTSGTPTLETMAATVGPDRAFKIVEGFSKLQSDQRGQFASAAGAIAVLPTGMQQDAYQAFRQRAIERGWATAKELPEQFSPAVLTWAQRQAIPAEKQAELAKGMIVPAGASVLPPGATTPSYTAPTKPPEPPAVGSFEDYVTRYAAEKGRTPAQLSPRDIEDARKRFLQAEDRPPDPLLTATRQLALEQAKANLGTLPRQQQTRVDAKSRSFDAQPVVKRVQTMAEAVTFAQSLDPQTTNPADDQALIYAFAKAMDPESVVREGEYATVQKYAQSWAQTFGFNAARIFSNTAFLTPQARQNMKATIQKRFAATKGQYDNLRSSYADQINRITGQQNGADYLTDYGGAFPELSTGGKGTITVGGFTIREKK